MRALIFGSTGTLGQSILGQFELNRWETYGVSRSSKNNQTINLNSDFKKEIKDKGPFDAIVFAQGMNANDTVAGELSLNQLLNANVTFIATAINSLLNEEALNKNSRITILGSIWQDVSRSNKFSYSVSKSALKGLMNSLVADLSPIGISINIVAPGVVDSPMTRSNLTNDQVNKVTSETPMKKLVTAEQVASLVYWVSSPLAAGVNGQNIRIDNGWSNVRAI
jgi:NAD(P)-dependent dehydrogenase (short-subunit alcohol dehydrogenase family)